MQRLDHPPPSAPDVLDFLNALHDLPGRATTANEGQLKDAGLRGLAVGCHVDNGLDLQVVVELSCSKATRTAQRQRAADMLAPDVDTGLADFAVYPLADLKC